jgi:hypothetical protein
MGCQAITVKCRIEEHSKALIGEKDRFVMDARAINNSQAYRGIRFDPRIQKQANKGNYIQLSAKV